MDRCAAATQPLLDAARLNGIEPAAWQPAGLERLKRKISQNEDRF